MICLLRPLLRCRLLLTAWTGSWVLTASAQACVRLEWRTQTPVVNVEDPLDIGLYAVGVLDYPGDDPDETFIAAVMLFGWDNGHLEFLGLQNALDPSLVDSGLLCPDTFCRANENCPTESPDPYPPPSDGTGLYQLTSEPRQSLTATPEGLLLTTFRFRTVAATPAASVRIQTGVFPCLTRVFDDLVPTINVLCPNGYGFIDIGIEPCLPMTIAQQPNSVVNCEGAPFTLSVVADGTPPFSYQWKRDGVPIPGATAAEYGVSVSGIADSGVYRVVVSNACGVRGSDLVTVRVWPNGSGDADGDGRLDGADVRAFVSVFQDTPNGPPDFGFCAADLSEDGVVNLTDAELLVTALLAS